MNTQAPTTRPTPSTTSVSSEIRARQSSLFHDIVTVAGRALRAVPKDLEAVIPPMLIAFFFFVVNVATLQPLTEGNLAGFDYTAFQMATAILLGVTGVSRAPAVVLDVQDGYMDRLLLTPVRRTAILLGHMVADMAVAAALTVPILALGFALGVRFESGPLGAVMFIVIAACWSLAFSGFGYAIALKTGNPAAVQSSFLLFFPFLFLTSSYVPRSELTGWLDTVAGLNPVTYILDGLRSLTLVGWEWDELATTALAIGLVAAVSMTLCFSALRSRVARG
ncbi:ABC transporter permease [Ilumatobacter nonamiensis]|uniref:ABC transporter permease n=1 Tax=Ilumatobacter nonamiensis TaxID=467093 RepID=UPI00068584DF|nr:ABC transporter permease [Ilumatobacter nonamiensis]